MSVWTGFLTDAAEGFNLVFFERSLPFSPHCRQPIDKTWVALRLHNFDGDIKIMKIVDHVTKIYRCRSGSITHAGSNAIPYLGAYRRCARTDACGDVRWQTFGIVGKLRLAHLWRSGVS